MKIKNSKIFIYEEDEKQRLSLRTQMLAQGALVNDFINQASLLEYLKDKVCDLIVFSLPSGHEEVGLGTIRAIKKSFPNLPVVVLSDLKKDVAILEALKSGASGYLIKPFTPWDLIKSIRKILFPRKDRSKQIQLSAPIKAQVEIPAEVIQVSSDEMLIRAPLSFKAEGTVLRVSNGIFGRSVRDRFIAQVSSPSDAAVNGLFKTRLDLEGLSEAEREEMKKVYFPWR